MKEKIIYAEKYKKGAIKVMQNLLPETLPFLEPGAKIKDMELQEIGVVEIAGKEFEYTVVRILIEK